jgi:hypothetical protein
LNVDRDINRTIPFTDYCALVQEHLGQCYGIRVITRDIPDPLTGDLNGAEIHIDYAASPAERFFLLAHLFGHTVQWNVDPRAFELGQPHTPPVPDSLLPALVEYEREAAGYAIWMLHQLHIHDADQWFCDYTASDMAYLLHYYRTGEKQEFRNFWREDAPLIQPRPVPSFTPMQRTFRLDGIVI